jgi:hypothetical protein
MKSYSAKNWEWFFKKTGEVLNQFELDLINEILDHGYDYMSKTYSPDFIFEYLKKRKEELEKRD